MKRIFSIIILLIVCLNSFAQSPGNDLSKYIWYKHDYGQRAARDKADSVLAIPTDTAYSKDGIAQIGSKFFVGNGQYWTQLGNVSTVAGSEINSGGIITQTGLFTLHVTAASYHISGAAYSSSATDLTLSPPDQYSYIAAVVVDTFGIVYTIAGPESANPIYPNIPPYVLPIGFVLVAPGGVTPIPTKAPIWRIQYKNDSTLQLTRVGFPPAAADTFLLQVFQSVSRRGDSVFYKINQTEHFAFLDSLGSGGTAYVDSVTRSQTGCIDSFFYWKSATKHFIGIEEHSNGVVDGTGIVTKTSGLTFSVTASRFTINCIGYTGNAGGITLDAAQDSGRLDRIVHNINGSIQKIKGTKGIAFTAPAYDTATQIPLALIYVSDTLVVSGSSNTNYWTLVGTTLFNNAGATVSVLGNLTVSQNTFLGAGNPASQTYIGNGLFVTNGVKPEWFSSNPLLVWGQTSPVLTVVNGTNTNNSVVLQTDSGQLVHKKILLTTDTSLYKPWGIDSVTGNVRRFKNWPGGGGTTPGLQAVITQDPVITATVNIDDNVAGTHDFNIGNINAFKDINIIGNGNATFGTTAGTTILSGLATSLSLGSIVNIQGVNGASNIGDSTLVIDVATGNVGYRNYSSGLSSSEVAAMIHDSLPTPSSLTTIAPLIVTNGELKDSSTAGAIKFYDPATGLGTGTTNATLDSSGNVSFSGTATVSALLTANGGLTASGVINLASPDQSCSFTTSADLILGGDPASVTGIKISRSESATPNVVTINANNGTILSTPLTIGIDLSSGSYTVTGPGTYYISTGSLANEISLPDPTTLTTKNTIDVYLVINKNTSAPLSDSGANDIYDNNDTILTTLIGGVSTYTMYHLQPVNGHWVRY